MAITQSGIADFQIRAGDRVTIVDRFGKLRTGRAVMRGPAGWVLDMGGRYGTPVVATPGSIYDARSARRRRNPKESDSRVLYCAMAHGTLMRSAKMVGTLGSRTAVEKSAEKAVAAGTHKKVSVYRLSPATAVGGRIVYRMRGRALVTYRRRWGRHRK